MGLKQGTVAMRMRAFYQRMRYQQQSLCEGCLHRLSNAGECSELLCCHLVEQEQSAAALLEQLDLEEMQLHALTADLRQSLTPLSTPNAEVEPRN